ncbi:MAG: HDOD domain-containing protein [Candidatus Glassbacteria bacterium]|nr:HDOD domain-containing protein [Candidatus Glassbacteria bacterium]
MPLRDDIKNKLTSSIEKMPSLPTTVGKIIQLANDINSSAKDILAVIQLDPVVAAKVMRLINSAYYGMPNKVSLKQAVVLLGINTIKNLALSSAVVNQMGKNKIAIKSFDQHRFWEHSLGTAIAARAICKKIGTDPTEVDEFFVSGLIHDLGKVVMALSLPMIYSRALKYGEDNKLSGIVAEKEKVGIDHAEVGSMLGLKWSLDEVLVDSILNHHHPAESSSKLTWVVHVANCFVSANGYENTGEYDTPVVDPRAFEVIGLERAEIEAELADLAEEIEKASVFLQS